jgi:uroporphyrin-III C-methyltransferase/precorrin-2 dehydrogenase/sirohydrochlorin ferrochelatase
MHSLPVFVRLSGRPVILLGNGDAAAAKRVLLERAGAIVCGEDGASALAIIAIDDEEEALAAVARLKARGILVNATDRPALCDFTLPAIIDRSPVLIAIGTGGASAGLAKALRQRLEGILPQSLGALATALQSVRGSLRTRWPDAGDRRRAIDAALDPGGPLDPLAGADADAVDRWLAGDDVPVASGVRRFELVSDDPDQLTLEQARLLGQADVIVFDTHVSSAILSRGRADALRLCADSVPEPQPDGLVIHLLRKGS